MSDGERAEFHVWNGPEDAGRFEVSLNKTELTVRWIGDGQKSGLAVLPHSANQVIVRPA